MGTALALGFLILVCGFIAYTGDLLGRRLGKRRLTMFGLRPRHTAVLCTIATGIVIAGTTLGAMMGLSAGVRLAVTRGEVLFRQNQQYRRDRLALQQEMTLLRSQVEPLREQNAALARENERIASANQTLATKNRDLTRSVETLRRSGEALQAENRRLEAANLRARRRLRKTRDALQTTQADLESARRSLTATRQDLETARKDLAASRDLILDNSRVVERLAARTQEMLLKADRLALSNIIVRDQEELARITVPAWTPEREARAQVEMLLAQVRQVARERGAQPKDGHAAAFLYNSRLARMLGPGAEWPRIPERDLVQAIATLVADSVEDVVLRAQSVQNTAKGEPVPFDIFPYWNTEAFRKGEEIASTVIDPGQTRGEILEDLARWLRTQVRQASAKRKVIPGPHNEMGEVRYDPLLEVVDKIQRLGMPAKVGAVAARDLRCADPLELDFYVIPAQTPVAARTTAAADEP